MRRSSRFQRPGLSGSSRSVVLLGGDGGGPSLNLDFSSGTLDPRITFTRSTIGTYYRGVFNQNLVTQSETFSTWTHDGMTVAASSEQNPFQSGVAQALTETATTAVHRIRISSGTSAGIQPDSLVTLSAYVKAGLRTIVGINSTILANTTTAFQLTGAGTVGTTQSNVVSAGIQAVGNGWYRIHAVIKADSSGTFTPAVSAFSGTSPTSWSSSYAGNNSAPAIYVWGVQETQGSLLTPYIPTTTAAITQGQIASAAIDLPRFEYNPVSGAFRGLLIEGGATNLLQQSAAVRTSPWSIANLTTAGTSITAPDGTANGVELVWTTGTAATSAYTFQDVTASAATAYTFSVFLKAKGTAINTRLYLRARATATFISQVIVLFNHSTGNVSLDTAGTWTSVSFTSTPVGNGWYRVTVTGTSPATTDNVRLFITNDATGNGTDGVYAWGAQFEAQAFASSYIPTTTATVARGADSAVMTGTNFSSWYNQSEGTLLAQFVCPFNIGTQLIVEAGSSSTVRLGIVRGETAAAQSAFFVVDSTLQAYASLSNSSPVGTTTGAGAYRLNDFAYSASGISPATDTVGTVPSVNQLNIGASLVPGARANGNIRRIAYWPTRLPNDQLVSLTTIPSTALAMTAIQAGAKIDLTWTQVPGVEGAIYEVERSTNGGATWSPLTTSFGLAFNDTTALFPGTYTYRVRANVGGEVTDWSSQVSETTVDVPSAPGSLTVTGATTSSISLSWTDSTGEDFYGIEVSPDGFAPWSLAGTAPANTTTFTHTPLNESTQRYYRVNGINKAGGGVYSSTVNSWTVPLAPTSLTATAVSSSQIDLAWTDVSTGNQSYKVERSTDNVNWTEIATGLAANATSYSAVGLTGSTLYYFRVRAANAARDSAYSNTASATTQAGGLTPAWSLDFSSGTPSGYTLTRASTGTYVDSSGYIASSSTDVARLTHDSSGSRLGLLVEGQRTNFARSTENVNTNMGNVSGATRTLDDGVAPDNATTADRVELTSSGFIYKSTQGTTTAGTYTASFYIKQKSASQTVRARFVTAAGANAVASTITTGADWQRVVLTTTTSTTIALEVGIDQRTLVGGPGTACDVLLWGFQIEEGATATSYIPNASTTASATRSADLAHVLDSSITNWGDPGALVIHFYAPGQAGTLISTDDASTAQVGIEASTTTAARAFWSSGSTATGTIGTGVQKAVHYWTGSTSKFCINGGTVQSGTNNFTIANADFVTLGAEATDSAGVPGTFSQYANCIIRKVEFYSGTLSDANLQTITT